MWLGCSPVCAERTWALCGPRAKGYLLTEQPERKMSTLNEALTQVNPPRLRRPRSLALPGSPPRPGLCGPEQTQKEPMCLFLTTQRWPTVQGWAWPWEQPTLSHTQTGPPRVEVVSGYLHQPRLPTAHHQLSDGHSNDSLGSEQVFNFNVGALVETRQQVTFLSAFIPSVTHCWIHRHLCGSQETTQDEGRPCTCLLIQNKSV